MNKKLLILLAAVLLLSGCDALAPETQEECLDMGGRLVFYDFGYDGPGTYKWRCVFD